VRDHAFREKAVAGSIEWFPPAPELEPHRLAHPPRREGVVGVEGEEEVAVFARIVRPPARATGRGAGMRPFGSTHLDRASIGNSPAGDRALDPGLVRPDWFSGRDSSRSTARR